MADQLGPFDLSNLTYGSPYGQGVNLLVNSLGSFRPLEQQFLTESSKNKPISVLMDKRLGTSQGLMVPGLPGTGETITARAPTTQTLQQTLQHELAHVLTRRLMSGLMPGTDIFPQWDQQLAIAMGDPQFKQSVSQLHPAFTRANIPSTTTTIGPWLDEFLAMQYETQPGQIWRGATLPTSYRDQAGVTQQLPDYREQINAIANYFLNGP